MKSENACGKKSLTSKEIVERYKKRRAEQAKQTKKTEQAKKSPPQMRWNEIFDFREEAGEVFFIKKGQADFAPLCATLRVVSIAVDDFGTKFVQIQNSEGEEVFLSVSDIHTPEGLKKLGQLVWIHGNRTAKEALVCYVNELGKKCERKIRLTKKTGWFSDDEGTLTYLMPSGETFSSSGIDNALVALANPRQIYRAAGTLEDWNLQVFRNLKKIPAAVLLIGVALAAPLLRFTKVRGGTFHLFGKAASGKSIIQCAAAPVWGRGDNFGIVRQWNSSYSGLENFAVSSNDGVIFLDEMTNNQDMQTVSNFVYTLSNGLARARSNKELDLLEPSAFSCFCISSGEFSLEQHLKNAKIKSNAGHLVRCFSVFCDTKKYVSKKEIDAIQEASGMFYGTASKHFVCELLKKSNVSEFVRNRFNENSDLFKCQNSQIQKAADCFQLALTALDIAIELGTIDIARQDARDAVLSCFREWHQENNVADSFEDAGVVKRLQDFLEINLSNFRSLDPNDRTTGDIIGYWQADGETTYFYILTSVFENKILYGCNKKTSVEYLKKIGWLITPKNENTTPIRSHSKNGIRRNLGRGYKFKGMSPP